jgi:hypothetical protein
VRMRKNACSASSPRVVLLLASARNSGCAASASAKANGSDEAERRSALTHARRHARLMPEGLHDFSTRLAARGSRLAALAILISHNAGAVPADAITESLVAVDHTAAHPPVDVYVTADGRVHADVRCAGCLLNAEVRRWTGPDGPGKELVAGASRIDLGAEDQFVFTPEPTDGHVFAWDVVLDIIDENEVADTVTHTFFGRIEGDSFVPMSWSEYAIKNRYAERRLFDGREQIVLLAPMKVECCAGPMPHLDPDNKEDAR